MTVSGVNVYKSPQIFPLITAPAGGRCSWYRARIDKSLSGIPRSRTGRRRRPCWRRSSISGVRRMRGSTGSARRRRSCAWTGSHTVPPPACHFARNVPSRIWPRPCRTGRRSRISCWSRRILPPAAGLKRTTSAASRNFVNSGLWVLSAFGTIQMMMHVSEWGMEIDGPERGWKCRTGAPHDRASSVLSYNNNNNNNKQICIAS